MRGQTGPANRPGNRSGNRSGRIPIWLLLGLIVVLSAASLGLSYVAKNKIYSGDHEGFPLKTGAPVAPAGTYQAGSELISASLHLHPEGNGSDTGNSIALMYGDSSSQATAEHQIPGSGAADLPDAFALNQFKIGYPTVVAPGNTSGDPDSANSSESGAIRTVDNTLITSIDGGSTWL